MRVRSCLFDLGNVVVDWQPLHLYRQVFDDPAEAERFCAEVCTLDWHKAHDRGRSFADGIAERSALHPKYAAEIALWHARWLDMFTGYVPGVPVLIARLEEVRVPLHALTNLSAEIAEETFDAFPLIRLFRTITVSGEHGVIKPDADIYRIALAAMGCAPEEVFFTDDREDNCAAARALGMTAHRFDGAEGLEAALVDAGLL